MSDKIVPFTGKTVRRTLPLENIETIGFLTYDDREIYISKREDIVKIMAFIKQNNIRMEEILHDE